MREHELENVVHDFINKKYDILLCTTIIESGVDIPNVNTIIMDNAQLLGLSQIRPAGFWFFTFEPLDRFFEQFTI